MTTQLTVAKKQSLFSAILTAGLIAGVLDGLSAIINFYVSTGRGPTLIFQYIASAVFGKEAFAGGGTMVALGVLFHLIIAMIFTIIFFLLYPRLPLLRKNKFLVGIAYGFFVWVIMNFIVVRLSRIPSAPFHWDKALLALAILIVCIGLPISLYANWYYKKVRGSSAL